MADAYGFNGDKSKFELDKLIGDDTMIEESPATANHAIGDYIVYESQLYKVTAAIATGEDLEVGTNITLTSVSSELAAIRDSLSGFSTLRHGKICWCGARYAALVPIPDYMMSGYNWTVNYIDVIGKANFSSNITAIPFGNCLQVNHTSLAQYDGDNCTVSFSVTKQ